MKKKKKILEHPLIKVLYIFKNLILIKKEIKNFFYDDFAWPRFWSHVYNSHGFWFWFYKTFTKTFLVQGNLYNYFYHQYNSTWLNERTVEISIIWEIVKRYQSQKILEIGNVLSYYVPTYHDIVDKYEKGEGVINEDVVNFHPSKKYDLIFSISTLEHVGWDEIPKDSMKVLEAIKNLKKLLNIKGVIVMTVPIGANPFLDKLLQENKIPFFKKICLKRISKNNKWKEVNWKDISELKYNYPFICANGLLIGIIK